MELYDPASDSLEFAVLSHSHSVIAKQNKNHMFSPHNQYFSVSLSLSASLIALWCCCVLVAAIVAIEMQIYVALALWIVLFIARAILFGGFGARFRLILCVLCSSACVYLLLLLLMCVSLLFFFFAFHLSIRIGQLLFPTSIVSVSQPIQSNPSPELRDQVQKTDRFCGFFALLYVNRVLYFASSAPFHSHRNTNDWVNEFSDEMNKNVLILFWGVSRTFVSGGKFRRRYASIIFYIFFSTCIFCFSFFKNSTLTMAAAAAADVIFNAKRFCFKCLQQSIELRRHSASKLFIVQTVCIL